MKHISAAFVQAQKAFAPALKTSVNPHFKSKYVTLAGCIEAVIDALNANGIALMQQCSESDSGVTVETVFLHESGEAINGGKLHVPAAKNDPQGYGSALTYARRYSLMAACGIAPEDDDGQAAAKASHDNRNERRDMWLADQYAAMDTASSTHALKKMLDDALLIANQERDSDAVQKLNTRAAAKLAKAKTKPEAATA